MCLVNFPLRCAVRSLIALSGAAHSLGHHQQHRRSYRIKLTEHLPPDRRSHVEARLHSNLMAWLTTVRPDGQPVSVPVWYLLLEDETFLIYSQPSKLKLRNIQQNPRVALGLDVTDIGRDIVRLDGTAQQVHDIPPADQNRQYVAKYGERIGAMFGTADKFAALSSAALLITPTRIRA